LHDKCRRLGIDLDAETSKMDRDLGKHLRKDMVLTHGDMHSGNLLERKGRVWAVDLEAVGPRPRECDLASLFMSLSGEHVFQRYPSVSTRRRFARRYLQECGLPCESGDVDDLLFGVELHWPKEMLQSSSTKLMTGRGSGSVSDNMLACLPSARVALVKSLSCPETRSQVMHEGVVAVARELHAHSSHHHSGMRIKKQKTSGWGGPRI